MTTGSAKASTASAVSVSAIVVVHGSPAATVDACVASLLASTGVDMHLVLVDNASPDRGAACAAWITHPQVTFVTSAANDGFAAGVNQGLAKARVGDLLVLLNDDATIAADALARCASVLVADPGLIAVAPRVMLAEEPDLIDSLGVVVRPNGEAFNAYRGQTWTEQLTNGADILGPCFGAAIFRPLAFDSSGGVGPIDERYRLYYEDIDWVLRSRRLGWRSAVCTDAVAWHQHGASARLLGEAARYQLVQRNLLLCAAKNFTTRRALSVWATRLAVHAKCTPGGPYRAERWRSVRGAFGGLASVFKARRALARQCRPLATTAERELFHYAAGMSPNFNVITTTYYVSDRSDSSLDR